MSDFSPRELGAYRPPGYESPAHAFELIARSERQFYWIRSEWTDETKACLYHSPEILERSANRLSDEEIDHIWPIHRTAWRFLREILASGAVPAVTSDARGATRAIPAAFWRTEDALDALDSGSISLSGLHDLGGKVFVDASEVSRLSEIRAIQIGRWFTSENLQRQRGQLLASIEAPEDNTPESLSALFEFQHAITAPQPAKVDGRPRAGDEAVFLAEVVAIVHERGVPLTKTEFVRKAQEAYSDRTGKTLSDDWVRTRIKVVWERLDVDNWAPRLPAPRG